MGGKMDIKIILSVILIALLTQVSSDRSRCPKAGTTQGFIYDRGEWCYQFILDPQEDWYEARTRCSNRGGRLVNMRDKATADWVKSKMQNELSNHFTYNGVWTGLHDRDTEGHFYWDALSGESEKALSYSNWRSGEPNDMLFGQDCVYMRKSYSYQWVDVHCTLRSYSTICEYKKIPPTTTTSTTTTSTSTTTTPTTTTSTTTVKPTTQPATTAAPTTTATPTTTTPKKLTAEVNPPFVADGLEGDTGDIGKTGAAHANAENPKKEHNVTYIVVGLFVALIVAIVIIIMLVLRRRRNRKEAVETVLSNVQLDNPCYRAGQLGVPKCSNNLSNETGTCSVQPSGNVYVEFNSQRALNVYEDADSGAAFAGELHIDDHGNKTACNTQNRYNSRRERDDCCGAASDAAMRLVDSGPIDDGESEPDGYMGTNHIYADIGEPREPIHTDHYDVPDLNPTKSSLSPTTTKHDELTVNMDHSKVSPQKSYRKNPLYDDAITFRQNPLYDVTLSGSTEDNSAALTDDESNVYAVPAVVNIYDTPRERDSKYDVPQQSVEIPTLPSPTGSPYDNHRPVSSEHSNV